MRSRRVPAHASICYKSRGLAAAPGPAAQGGETRATQGDGYDVVELGERLRGISLGSSGDTIIHMWIIKDQRSQHRDLESRHRASKKTYQVFGAPERGDTYYLR